MPLGRLNSIISPIGYSVACGLPLNCCDSLAKTNVYWFFPKMTMPNTESELKSALPDIPADPEVKFQAIFNAAMDVMLVVDDRGRYLDVNPAAVEALGFSREEILQTTIAELFFPGADGDFDAAWQDFLARGRMRGEIAYRHPDGTQKTFDFCATANVVPGQHLSVLRDVTERKQLSYDLQRTEARFHHLIDSSLIGIVLGSVATGSIVEVNNAFLDMTGYDREDFLSGRLGWPDITPPEYHHLDQKALQELIEKGATAPFEKQYITRDGRRIDVLLAGLLDATRENIVVFVVDMTQNKLAEKKQQDSLRRESLIRQIVEFINQTFDLSLILTEVAEKVGRFFETDRAFIIRYEPAGSNIRIRQHGEYYRSDEVPKMNVEGFPPKILNLLTEDIPIEHAIKPLRLNNPDEYYENIRSRMQELLHLSDEEKVVNADLLKQLLIDQFCTNAFLRVGIYYRGIPYGVITLQHCSTRTWEDEDIELLQDIATQIGVAFYQNDLYHQAQQTARQENLARQELEVYAGKLERSNRELEHFATITSHDLQAPLRKIRMFSDHLKKISSDTLSPEALDDIVRLERATARMQQLVSDLLNLSRVTRRGEPFRRVHLGKVIREAAADLNVQTKETGGQINITGDVELQADPGQLRQLMQNLIENALKYHRPDVPPQIDIVNEVIDGGQCRITVTDNGIGFEEKYLDRIFEVFQRLHSEASDYKGTGIGLAICQKIVERHGGTITARSTPGSGSTFQVVLPLLQGA